MHLLANYQTQATQSLKQLLTTSDFKKNDEPLITLVRRLVSSESQMSRVVAANIIPAIYPRIITQ